MMSSEDDIGSFEVLVVVLVTSLAGRRMIIPPGIVMVSAIPLGEQSVPGERVTYAFGGIGAFDLVEGEFKRLSGTGKIRAILRTK
jgi:hypothetical protein